MHVYEVRPRKDKRGVDLISDVLPFGRLWYDGSNAVTNATGYAMHDSRSHDAVIRVYDADGNVIETHEHKGDFKEFRSYSNRETVRVRLYYLEGMGSLSVGEILAAGGPPSKTKKGRRERQVKKFFLVAFVVSGLAFVPVQHSDAQIEIGIPGIWPKPGGSRGYPHFEYGYYPSGGWYYRSPFYGDYGGSSYHHHRHHYYHRNWGDQGHQDEQ